MNVLLNANEQNVEYHSSVAKNLPSLECLHFISFNFYSIVYLYLTQNTGFDENRFQGIF